MIGSALIAPGQCLKEFKLPSAFLSSFWERPLIFLIEFRGFFENHSRLVDICSGFGELWEGEARKAANWSEMRPIECGELKFQEKFRYNIKVGQPLSPVCPFGRPWPAAASALVEGGAYGRVLPKRPRGPLRRLDRSRFPG